MALITFPNTPSLNDEYTAENGTTYKWNGTVWKIAQTPDIVITSPTAPANPKNNQLWFDGQSMLMYYFDGTQSQWIQLNGVGPQGIQGEQGIQGIQGIQGPVGLPYQSAVTTLTYQASSTTTIDLSDNARMYLATANTGPTTWVFSNPPSTGTMRSFEMELTNGGSQTQTWPTGITWDAGAAPSLTSAGTDVLTFYTHDAGVTWRGFLSASDVK